MHPFLDDYDELDEFDELSFDSFAAARRLLGKKHHLNQKGAGRKRRSRAHFDRWADDDENSRDDSYDYSDDEFDRHYGTRVDD